MEGDIKAGVENFILKKIGDLANEARNEWSMRLEEQLKNSGKDITDDVLLEIENKCFEIASTLDNIVTNL